ncbi:hypothetical protein [Tahibacter harae]|uniref:Uncharacterized protein n=1 Tax=Tahibacter harae TaxID=2963937 RepID=A0ABT1QV65_9GAMM|nr:hypothetical protein [Tahibacter harae]MCQ4166168.1 hypothetical protein [Tahibacter harae]
MVAIEGLDIAASVLLAGDMVIGEQYIPVESGSRTSGLAHG